jgi:hypothetical protein
MVRYLLFTTRKNNIRGERKRTQTHAPLSWHVSIPSRNPKQERIESSEFLRMDDLVVQFRGSVHLREDCLREGLWDSIANDILRSRNLFFKKINTRTGIW